jgi:XTP/dITP diphosphohydrolase
MNKTWCLATHNPGKVREFRSLLEPHGYQVQSLDDLGLMSEHAETGITFAENARLKALRYSTETGLPVLGDDSGLEVMALGGRPGIHSARYAGPNATDAQKIGKLLDELSVDGGARDARFICALALASMGRLLVEVQGQCSGVILPQARGSGGFGYDPVFYFPGLGKTFAELDESEKNSYSHRGEAVRALLASMGSAWPTGIPR